MKTAFLPSNSPLEVWTAEERPDLWTEAKSLFTDVWPEYNLHGNHTARLFGSLVPHHAQYQLLLYDRERERVVARGRTIPMAWDGSFEDLPSGMDAAGERAIKGERSPTCLCALAAEVENEQQGRGLSMLVLQAMTASAQIGDLERLIAPVRPNRKHRYPLISIDRYAHWRRGDGLPFDPWMRVHARLGAVIVRVEPRSLQIEATTADWESWTDMEFPEDGEYVFPEGLTPLSVKDAIGSYWEPNVWMLHNIA